MMILYRYKELLFLLRIITTMAIPLLSIFIYKTYKDKKLLFLTILIIMELIIIQFEVYNLNSILIYLNEIFMIFTLVKLILIFIMKKDNSYSNFINILFIASICFLTCLQFGITFLGNRVFSIIINLWILNILCFNSIYLKYNQSELNKNKLHINKKYISKIIYDTKEESIMGKCVKEEIKGVNDKIFRIAGVINIPIIIIKCCNHKCIFKNKYFDEFLLEHNYELKDFNVEDFIENFVKLNSKEIFKKIKQMNFSKENFLSMDIDDKKYKIVMVKDYLEGEEILICEMKDVTQVSMEEEKLKRSELRYKTLMDILTDGVIIHDGNNVSYINKIALDIFDLNSSINNVWTIDKIMKKVCKKNKDNFRYNILTMKNDSQNEQKSQIELENGKIVNIISSTFILNNEKMILTIVSDFTQNKISLNKLEENKKTYYALLQTLPEGIILVNRYTKKQVYANKYMMRILKDMGMEKFNEIIDSYISSKENSNFKTFYINPNINKKISIAIKQVPNQNNLLVVVRDLQIEQQMEVVYNNLQLIKERNKFKTEFLIRASSNLKKPINTIFEVNKFLDSKKDIYNYDGMKNYTKTVKQNSYRLKRLLNNIEEISEIESGIYYRNYKTYDIVNYLVKLVDLCSEYTKKKDIDINFESSKREVLLYMDKDKIEKIILNILSNAIKFTEKGGKIKVLLTVTKKDVIIAIKDNGSGIPSNKIDFIFENFEQVNRSLSRTAEGTGVGLYLVKKLAQLHHAKIRVNSKIGYGSKFEIILKNNFLENTQENRNKVENIIIDKEDIDLEFSDIYLE